MTSNDISNDNIKPNDTINTKVCFSQSRVAELLRKMESFLGIPLSLRSTTGEVVCKTDYFYGPCSFIRGTEVGCQKCRKVYQNIENKILRRKVPFVCLCYCGFLIYAVPLEFRGEMVGILFGSQILPVSNNGKVSDFKSQFEESANELGLSENQDFFDSLNKIKTLNAENQRQKFLSYMEEIGKHFVEMALADKPWNVFIKEIKSVSPDFGQF